MASVQTELRARLDSCLTNILWSDIIAFLDNLHIEEEQTALLKDLANGNIAANVVMQQVADILIRSGIVLDLSKVENDFANTTGQQFIDSLASNKVNYLRIKCHDGCPTLGTLNKAVENFTGVGSMPPFYKVEPISGSEAIFYFSSGYSVNSVGDFLTPFNVVEVEMRGGIEGFDNNTFDGSEFLQKVVLYSVRYVQPKFLRECPELVEFKAYRLEVLNDTSIRYNTKLHTLVLPMLSSVDMYCLDGNDSIESLNLPNLSEAYGISNNNKLKYLTMPRLDSLYEDAISNNVSLIKLYAPNLTSLGNVGGDESIFKGNRNGAIYVVNSFLATCDGGNTDQDLVRLLNEEPNSKIEYV